MIARLFVGATRDEVQTAFSMFLKTGLCWVVTVILAGFLIVVSQIPTQIPFVLTAVCSLLLFLVSVRHMIVTIILLLRQEQELVYVRTRDE
jgi:hypothetical protein